jgi:hypothetical protein
MDSKVRGKTVSVALSREQFEWLRSAIANWREVQRTLKEMQCLSREFLFTTVPHPPRRKRPGKEVLGLIQGPFRTTRAPAKSDPSQFLGTKFRLVPLSLWQVMQNQARHSGNAAFRQEPASRLTTLACWMTICIRPLNQTRK